MKATRAARGNTKDNDTFLTGIPNLDMSANSGWDMN